MEAASLPRILAGWRDDGPLSVDEHEAIHGPLAPPGPRRRAELADEVERSGLRGRGGAGFPAATKLRAVAAKRGRRVVVVNAAEGEPASRKDRVLLAGAPHLVLDGALIAAAVVGAGEVIFAIKRTATAALDAVERALAERNDTGAVDVSVVEVPAAYVAGEETALVNYLNTGRVLPTFVPPRPFERGVDRRPTLIQNVETLAHMALIARRGAEWFREIGTAEDPGSNLVSLAGAVARPGVYEIESGTALVDLVEAAGGPIAPLRAFLLGGYGGTWVTATRASALPLGRDGGAGTLGAGVVVALADDACGVCETARVSRYLADESAGQCGPCVHGVAAIADAFAEIADGVAEPGTHRWIKRWSEDVAGRGACRHPDGAAQIVGSALFAFGDEIERHEAGENCTARGAGRWTLPLPDAVDAIG
jgi:NADH:ubiquinone oxidoreductase subunit F (NADH-binding)